MQCSADYDKNHQITKEFFATVQCSLFWTVAKNYLKEEELEFFNRIVTMYLDYAEFQAKNKKVMYMKDWVDITPPSKYLNF